MDTVHGCAAETPLAGQLLAPETSSSGKGDVQVDPLGKRSYGTQAEIRSKTPKCCGEARQESASAFARSLQAWALLNRQRVRTGDAGIIFQPSSFPSRKRRAPVTWGAPTRGAGDARGSGLLDGWVGLGFDLQNKTVFPRSSDIITTDIITTWCLQGCLQAAFPRHHGLAGCLFS